jgi:hypothetical protein
LQRQQVCVSVHGLAGHRAGAGAVSAIGLRGLLQMLLYEAALEEVAGQARDYRILGHFTGD